MTQPSSETPPETARGSRNRSTRLVAAIARQFPPGQFAHYLIVGVCNTLFGYSTYAGLTALLTPHVPYAYVAASVIGGFFAFTFSYWMYKVFVFRTKGNYLREWLRGITVYSISLTAITVLLPPIVYLLRHLTSANRSAPYIAGALLTGINAVSGFLGHKHFSFAKPE